MLEVPAAGLAAARREAHHLANSKRPCSTPTRRASTNASPRTPRSTSRSLRRPATPCSAWSSGRCTAVSDRKAAAHNAPPPMWRVIDRDHRNLLAAIRDQDVDLAMEIARGRIDNVRPSDVRRSALVHPCPAWRAQEPPL